MDAQKTLYPLKFSPIFKEKIWGGTKLKTTLGKDFAPLTTCGESWELSGVKGNESIVKKGALSGTNVSKLIELFQEKLVGQHVLNSYGHEFPLLIKFLDAKEDLSIQVHPEEHLAQKRHNSHGKTEMWYIMQADENASLISGFKQKINKEKLEELFRTNNVSDVLNREFVQSGDVFFIPAGRVHTIGAGILLAEIQQTSDLTYRIYDFDRVDKNGEKRALHTDLALEAINFEVKDSFKSTYSTQKNKSVEIVSCPFFTTRKLYFDQQIDQDYSSIDSFIIYMCVEGNATIEVTHSESVSIEKGEVILLPAMFDYAKLTPNKTCELLEIYIKPTDS